MRAAAILGLGCSTKNLKPFQIDKTIEWRIGMRGASGQADVILLFGGDGTIHRHLRQLVKIGRQCWLFLPAAGTTLLAPWASAGYAIRLPLGDDSAEQEGRSARSIWG
jgi:hypothetical protein